MVLILKLSRYDCCDSSFHHYYGCLTVLLVCYVFFFLIVFLYLPCYSYHSSSCHCLSFIFHYCCLSYCSSSLPHRCFTVLVPLLFSLISFSQCCNVVVRIPILRNTTLGYIYPCRCCFCFALLWPVVCGGFSVALFFNFLLCRWCYLGRAAVLSSRCLSRVLSWFACIFLLLFTAFGWFRACRLDLQASKSYSIFSHPPNTIDSCFYKLGVHLPDGRIMRALPTSLDPY